MGQLNERRRYGKSTKSTWLKITAKSSGYVLMRLNGSGTAPVFTGYYSVDDGMTWTSFTDTVTIDSVQEGQCVFFKGIGSSLFVSGGKSWRIYCTCNFDISGNVMSLLYGDDYEDKKTLLNDYAFLGLFYGNSKLQNASDLILPATTLSKYCYQSMFGACSSLTAAPALPAMTLADHCYLQMFNACTSLTSAPELPATTLAQSCYYYMFYGCASLTTAPALPATTATSLCYSGMFQSCINLITAPTLPAMTLDFMCYSGMFYGCTSLTKAPALPATTLAQNCYSSMFSGCTSLKNSVATSNDTVIVLPATILVQGCYNAMFNNCTSLTSIKAMFTTTPSSNYTANWMKNVASSGTFIKNRAARWNVTGVDGIPSGWKVQTASS